MSNNTIKVRTFNPGAGAYGEDGPAYQGNLRKGELRGIIHINKEHCVGCDTCSKFCPVNAIEGGLGAKHHIIEDACLYCGQCLIACPFDAIEQMSFVDQVEKVLADKSRLCVAHPSPAVRVSICEEFGGKPGELTTEQLSNALEAVGFQVYDCNSTADQTILEEGTEFVKKARYWLLGERSEEVNEMAEHPFPHFTSCCPAWVKNMETNHADLIPHVSTAKSPLQMGGALAKTWGAKFLWKCDPRKIFFVSVTPCTAKIFEAARPEMNQGWHWAKEQGMIPADAPSYQDIDACLTARDLAELFRRKGVNPLKMDKKRERGTLEIYTGAGTIFGVSGGVMEAALRTVYYVLTGKEHEQIVFEQVRGLEGIREASLDINGMTVNVAIANGMKNAKVLLDQIRAGESKYHFIEIMGCPGGCINGGGQPYVRDVFLPNEDPDIMDTYIQKRAQALYSEDEAQVLRQSHKNPQIQKLYEEYLGKPNSHKAHHLLHTTYAAREGFND